MTSASSRAVFLFVGQQGRRVRRLVAPFLSKLCLGVLRVIVTSVVFITCAALTLRYFGIPVPGPYELLDRFEDLGRLARILS
jgi:hypothetical protein